jgi:hypothetical protein
MRELLLPAALVVAVAAWPAAATQSRPAAAWAMRAPAGEGDTPLGSGRLVYHRDRARPILIDAVATGAPPPATGPLGAWSWTGAAWERLGGAGPSYRVVNAAVYDSARRRVVMFGGATIPATTSLAETWEFDGRSWTRSAGTIATGRDHHAMAYDERRRRTVLFGGGTFVRGEPYRLHDTTWEWDGVEWRQVATEGPGGRRLPAMTYDGWRGHVVLFGGVGPRTSPDVDPPVLGDTWAWNGAAWQRAAEGGPPPRYGHGMIFDAHRGVVLMYGGNTTGDTPLADMWQWDGRRWTEVSSANPTPGARFGHAMVFNAARRLAVLVGGRRGDASVWEWGTGTRRP